MKNTQILQRLPVETPRQLSQGAPLQRSLPGAGPAGSQGATPARDGGTGDLVLSQEDPADPALLPLWRAMLGSSESAEKIYQSPEFFSFLCSCPDGDPAALFSVARRDDGRILGLVPVRLGRETLDYGIAPLLALAPRMKVVRILGSVPLLALEGDRAQQLIDCLFARYPEADAISMQAVPIESDWWQAVAPGLERGARQRAYVLNDWRDCHTIPLPESFELYLKQFSAKKRYNLSRQVKQLEKQVGAMSVERIVDAGQVPAMLAVASALATPYERNGLLSEAEFMTLADAGLLLSYVVSCGGTACGAVIGSLSNGVWHVYKILWDARYAGLSIGTSILHVSIEDAIAQARPVSIDLGYGSPNRDFNSSHKLMKRAHVLLYRHTLRNRLAVLAHAGVTSAAAPLRKAIKDLRKRIMAARAKGGGSPA